MPHRSVAEAPAQSTAHDTEPVDLLRQLGERGEEESDVRQRARRHEPDRPRRLREKSIAHGHDSIAVAGRGRAGFREEIGAIEPGCTWWRSVQSSPVPVPVPVPVSPTAQRSVA